MKIAMYIGSFDPFTSGHLSVVNTALVTLDKLIICVGKNDAKTPMFTAEERKSFIELAIADYPRAQDISVITNDGLTVDIARRNNVNTLIRGVRSNTDMHAEEQLAETNRYLAAQQGFKLKTVFITQTDAFLKTISSSLVRKLLKMKKYSTAARCLPLNIAQRIIANELKPLFCELFHKTYDTDELWNKIVEAYTPRPYHNLLHLAYMFDMYNLYQEHKYKNSFRTQNDELIFAIFLHDYVYEPSKNNSYQNEKDSADFAYKLVRNQAQNCINALTVFEAIMATTHDDTYLTDDHWRRTQLIADLDLSILGTADPTTWKNYTEDIRKEYADYSDEKYNLGRLEFLSALLEKEHIFHTDFFREMLETQARRNLRAEVKRLLNNF